MRFKIGITAPTTRVEEVLRAHGINAVGSKGTAMLDRFEFLRDILSLPKPPFLFFLEHKEMVGGNDAQLLAHFVNKRPATIVAKRENSIDLNALQVLHEDTKFLLSRPTEAGLLYYGIFRDNRAHVAKLVNVIYAPSERAAFAWARAGAKSVRIELAHRGRHLYDVDTDTPIVFASTRYYELVAGRCEIEITPFARERTIFPEGDVEKYALSVLEQVRTYWRDAEWKEKERQNALAYIAEAMPYMQVFRDTRLVPARIWAMRKEGSVWYVGNDPFVRFLPHRYQLLKPKPVKNSMFSL